MTKQQILRFLELDHRKLEEVINNLPEEEMTTVTVCGEWTVKDVLAHIAWWRWQLLKDIDDILANKILWYAKPEFEETNLGDETNAKIVADSRAQSLSRVIHDWQTAYEALYSKISNLSEDQIKHDSGHKWWNSKYKITIKSLFGYKYNGAGHEGGHAKQIQESFKQFS